ncbi:MAG: tetratricopeptide repeat protein [Candidatus Hydrogenedentes bacterium]|nr:tetratricopeptide repeat protein [Candidatus Hydrogenedentota bacterium]
MMTSAAVLLMLVSSNAFNETFERATQAYADKDYGRAVQLYEQLVADGVEHPHVFYNLGDAYYRKGRLGWAIANYERALQLDPGFQSAQHNLDQCLAQTKRQLARPLPPDWEQSVLFWHYSLSRRVTLVVGLVCWIAMWLALGFRLWRMALGKPRPRYMRRLAALFAVIAVAFGVSAWVKAHPAMRAVASEPLVPVRYGMSDDEVVRFELYEGDRVMVDDRRDGWARVVTATGYRGWARDEGLAFVGPPYELPPKPEALAAEADSAAPAPRQAGES